VPDWERLVRRLVDAGTQVVISGSSARLLSREVATSLRGRAMEVLVHHSASARRFATRGPNREHPTTGCRGRRLELDDRLRRYLASAASGGAGPSAADRAGAPARLRRTASFCADVIERHQPSQPIGAPLDRTPAALPARRAVLRQQADDPIRSQGIPAAKDTLHAYLAHLEDSFLVRTVSINTTSERQRMSNPRKAYPVDSGLIALVRAERPREAGGAALETPFSWSWERRGFDVAYVRNAGRLRGRDFLADSARVTRPLLLQSPWRPKGRDLDRELRALERPFPVPPGSTRHPRHLDAAAAVRPLPDRISWLPPPTGSLKDA